ncbi:hypothetical protein BT67DRAFT_385049 [Trichocladium antarcticum]|uniref:Large ribosomal subunit protein mL54 n=1 Tax=Trichocladium antarcticum TaxID=1450529 RepID=A0AAN6ZBW6_9PEZI|nr:hypothetical protein BT67DRAFT_385049 [Trichocladium antarcticum]
MICRTCLRQATGPTARRLAARPLARTTASRAAFSTTPSTRNAAPTAPAAAAAAAASPAAESAAAPDLKPLTADEPKQAPLSSCEAGRVLTGLNYFKNQADPVAQPDDAYPAWLWRCLEVQKKAADAADADAGDEFSKSKKQRRLALKRSRAQEARLLASGDLEALVPKIPLQKQTVNLSAAAAEGGGDDLGEAVRAVDQREELRKAMRKERRAKIKETNYLKTM